MYIIHDRFTPHIQEYMHALRIKNIILRYWPTRWVNGVEVMDSFFLYDYGVVDSVATRKILPLLNTTVEELKKEDFDGLKWYWLYFKRLDLDYIISATEIKNYIELHSPLVDGFSEWQTASVIYAPIRPVYEGTSDVEIISYLNSAVSDTIQFPSDAYNDITGDNDPINRLLGIALLDNTNILFEKQFNITSKNTSYRSSSQRYNTTFNGGVGSGKLVEEVHIDIRYRRKAVVDLSNPSISAFIDFIKDKIENLDNIIGTENIYPPSTFNSRRQLQNVSSRLSSINATLKNLYIDAVPATEDDINYVFGNKYYVKKSGLEALKVKDFVWYFARSIDTGYKEEDASFWEKFWSFVLAAVVIVVAVISGGAAIGGLGALVGASASTVFVFAGAFALALSVGTFLLQGLAILAGERGLYGFAAYLGKVINFLGIVSTIAGIVSVYAAFKVAVAQQVAKEAAATVLKEAGEEITSEALEVALKDIVIKEVAISEVGLKTLYETAKSMLWGGAKQSLMDIINKTVSAVSWTAGYFMEKDLAALQGDLIAQQEKADELKQEYEHYKGSVDKVYYSTSEMYDGYYNPYFNDFELSTGEGPDRIWATKAHWRCQNSIDWLYK